MSEQKPNLEGKIPLEEVLVRFNKTNEEFKNRLDQEEQYEDSIETVDSIQNDIKGIKQNTDIKKVQFIREMKAGLGQQIKENPTQITVVKKKWYERLGAAIKGIFTRF